MTDEVVTYEDVARWLPREVRHELLMALPPHQRGWWTAEEANEDGGRFVEVTRMGDAQPTYWRTGD